MTDNKKILVAISGGADSVALLHMLHSDGYVCEAAHCNFHLRAAESDRDEQFVRDFCASLGVVLHVTHFDTRAYAASHGISIEMAARDLRYDWFARLLSERGLDVVAVAHHADDAAETLLLNLTRGTGLRGLTGMKELNGHVWRPMLSMSRQDVEDYCREHALAFVTDSSNASDDYSRNRIRHHVLPALKAINPSLLTSLRNTSRHVAAVYELFLAQVSDFATRHVTRSTSRVEISTPALTALSDPEPFLHELLADMGFSSSAVMQMSESLVAGRWGRAFFSPDWRAIVDRHHLIIQQLSAISSPDAELLIDSPSVSIEAPIRLVLKQFATPPDFSFSRDPRVVHLDASRLTFPLTLRHWRQGDVMRPLGMKGNKKLSDLFTDCKLSIVQKEDAWVVVNADGAIVWVVGLRLDDRFKYVKGCRSVVEISFSV